MNQFTSDGSQPSASHSNMEKRFPAWNKKWQIVFLFILTTFMAGMNFLPNDWIDPFNDSDSSNSEIPHFMLYQDSFFNPKVAERFKTVEDLATYVRKHSPDTSDKLYMARYLNKILKRRFIHAYAIYSVDENWLAVLAGRLVWRDLSAKVIPNEILKGNVAACSQVSIIFMDACSKLGISSRKVGLKGHYALETYSKGDWYFFDADMKPNFSAIDGHKSVTKILKDQEHFKLYNNTPVGSNRIREMFSKIHYGIPNESPAPRAALFHVITKNISHWGWIVPLACAIFILLFKKETIVRS